jgi:hypothetical protein
VAMTSALQSSRFNVPRELGPPPARVYNLGTHRLANVRGETSAVHIQFRRVAASSGTDPSRPAPLSRGQRRAFWLPDARAVHATWRRLVVVIHLSGLAKG